MIRRVLAIICFSFCTLLIGQTGQSAKGVSDVHDPPTEALISIYPNPAVNYFKVKGPQNIQQVVVTDLVGKRVKTFEYVEDAQYDVHELRKGMYLVQFVSVDQQVLKIQRLIKNTP